MMYTGDLTTRRPNTGPVFNCLITTSFDDRATRTCQRLDSLFKDFWVFVESEKDCVSTRRQAQTTVDVRVLSLGQLSTKVKQLVWYLMCGEVWVGRICVGCDGLVGPCMVGFGAAWFIHAPMQ